MPSPEQAPATKADLIAFAQEIREAFAQQLREAMQASAQEMRKYIDERSRDLQTEILRGFADYNSSANVRFRKLEADVSNIDTSTTQRIGELERQMTEFKIRLMALEGHRSA